jgi:hypothetical protein
LSTSNRNSALHRFTPTSSILEQSSTIHLLPPATQRRSIDLKSIPSSFHSRKSAESEVNSAPAMADILVAMAQHAQRVVEQETFLQGTKAGNHESNLSLASNAEAQTNKPEQSDKEKRSDEAKPQSVSVEGTGKGKGKAAEQDRPKCTLVKLAFFKNDEDDSKERTRIQLRGTVLKIRINIYALRSANQVGGSTTGPRQGNEGAFRILNRTIEINNFMIKNEGNEKTIPVLENFLKSAGMILGGDIPLWKTYIDSNIHQALSDVMGVLENAHERLQELKRRTSLDGKLSEFKKKKSVSFGKDHLRESEDSDEGEPVRKKTKVSGKSTKDTTKKGSKTKGKK